jgi:hypothetical protein
LAAHRAVLRSGPRCVRVRLPLARVVAEQCLANCGPARRARLRPPAEV